MGGGKSEPGRTMGTHRRPTVMAEYGVFIGFARALWWCNSLADASFQAGGGSSKFSKHGRDKLGSGDLLCVKL